jgi:Mrp family chromosome partitioning ATPase
VHELVAHLQTQFDCVILDTAPTLPFPDARLLGKYSDGVVLIVRCGITTRATASTACQRFLDDGIPVLGTILNDWAPRVSGAQDRYLYGYGLYGNKAKIG